MGVRRWIWAALGCAFATYGAAAADYKDTNDFLAQCAGDTPSEDCVLSFQIDVAANGNWGNGEAHEICLPSTDKAGSYKTNDALLAELRKEMAAVTTWLKAHPEYAAKSDVDSVGVAAEAVFPCKEKKK